MSFVNPATEQPDIDDDDANSSLCKYKGFQIIDNGLSDYVIKGVQIIDNGLSYDFF